MKVPEIFACMMVGAAVFPVSSKAQAPAAAPASAVAGTTQLKIRQSKVKGLLVKEIGPSEFAGMASQMNATAVASGDPSSKLAFKFNQKVGEMMETALHEVEKFLSVRHDNLPTGWTVEISFEDKFLPKDGPSAAVACALMLDSLITGDLIDEGFACTGDLNADGAVQPVGGVPSKIEGAVRKQCTVISVPDRCAAMVQDHLIATNIRSVAEIQIFTTKTFDEAKRLAVTARDAKVKESMEQFALIRKALLAQKDPSGALRHPAMIQKLQQVLAATPNCLSASLLLAKAQGRDAKTLSPAGSVMAIDKASGALIRSLQEGGKENERDALQADSLGTSISTLNALRPKLDKRIQPYCDAMLNYGRIFRQHTITDPVNARASAMRAIGELKTAGQRVIAEMDKLRADKTLQSQLME